MGQGDDEPGFVQHGFARRPNPSESISAFESMD
jgi:hypothetical protein